MVDSLLKPKVGSVPADLGPPRGWLSAPLKAIEAELFVAFWNRIRTIEDDFARVYGHLDPVGDWQSRPDRDLARRFGRLRRLLKPLARPAAFPAIPGLPGAEGPIVASTAHEAIFELNRFPARWIGALRALDGEPYAALRAEAELELQCLLHVRSVNEIAPAVRPAVRGEFDPDGRLVFQCVRSGHATAGPIGLREQSVRLLMVLASSEYRDTTTGWDEFVWDQIWGARRRDGRRALAYRPGVKPDGSGNGPPDRFRRAISTLKQELRAGFGLPPGGVWVQRLRMTPGQRAYRLTEHADWRVIPFDMDPVRELPRSPDELDGLGRRSGRRRLKPIERHGG